MEQHTITKGQELRLLANTIEDLDTIRKRCQRHHWGENGTVFIAMGYLRAIRHELEEDYGRNLKEGS